LYRNQWASVTSPFRTEAFFAEKRVEQHGLGFNLVNNHAGSTGFRQLYAGGQWSISKQLGKNRLSAGLYLGILQRSFDPSSMTFDEQYSPDQGSSAAIPHTENFTAMSKLRPDAGMGMLWRYTGVGTERFTPFAGVGATHLNKPRETYILEESAVEPRYTVQAGTGYRISETVSLASLLQFSKQSVSRELMASIRGQIKLNETSDIEGLLLFRNADAMALGVAYRWFQYSIGMSYDVNISGITGVPGGAEITLAYTPEIRTRAKRERKTVETEIQQPTQPVTAVHVEKNASVTEGQPVQNRQVESTLASEKISPSSQATAPGAEPVAAGVVTPLSEAVADILMNGELPSDSISTSPPFSTTPLPDLADILAAFANGGEGAAKPVTYAVLSEGVMPTNMEPIAVLPITPVEYGATSPPGVVMAGSYPGRTSLPIAQEEPLTTVSSKIDPKTERQVIPERHKTSITERQQVELDYWIGFEQGNSRVHGLYKLDVIEPVMDLLLNDTALSLELSMPESQGQTARKGIVKDIFVTKGLEPARIRILPETRGGITPTDGQAGAVRIRILRAQ
jgi:type IX secretion system PorP/SprF family membrane protein